jgi:hypothetical protein
MAQGGGDKRGSDSNEQQLHAAGIVSSETPDFSQELVDIGVQNSHKPFPVNSTVSFVYVVR